MILRTAILALVVLIACEPSETMNEEIETAPVGLISDSIAVDTTQRSFILYVPESYQQDKAMPLLLTFHGYGSSANTIMNYSGYNQMADSLGFIVAYPKGSLMNNGTTHWNVGGWTLTSTADDILFVNELLDHIKSNYSIDEDRIYANGMSNGGYMSLMLACNESETFAAVASITGAMTPQMFDNCNPTNPVPVLQFHADEDGTVPYEGNESWTMGIPKVINFWVDHNGASDSPIITAIDDVAPNDGSTVERFEYKAAESYAPVIHYFVKGGGHDWPGAWGNKDISASELVWDFFSEYNNNGTQ